MCVSCGRWDANAQIEVTLVSDRIGISVVRDDQDRPVTSPELVLVHRTCRKLDGIVRLKRSISALVLITIGIDENVVGNIALTPFEE